MLSESGSAARYHGTDAMSEQMGLSLAVASLGLGVRRMTSDEHAFVWREPEAIQSDPPPAVMHFSGGPRVRLMNYVERRRGLFFKPLPFLKGPVPQVVARRAVEAAALMVKPVRTGDGR